MTYSLDRVRVVHGTPPASPGKCVICGNCGDKDSKFIDFGFDIDFYGVVYFCKDCINQVLTILMYVPIEELEKVVSEKIEVQFKLEALEAQNKELLSVIDSLQRHGFAAPVTDPEQSDVVAPVPEEPETTEPTSRKTTATKSRSTKQANESRSTGIRNNDTPEEFPTEFKL